MQIAHLFIPHLKTHKKAHLLRWPALFGIVLLFILLQVGFQLTNYYKPGVLGINSTITAEEVLIGTNAERAKIGLPALKANSELSAAAKAKAENMFAENYWAHFAPSGKDPWGFINGAGYKFSFAGENLARNFYTSDEVITAWMNSPTHKANLLNPKYEDIGIAVVDGVLMGQKTTLIVQEFGHPYEALADASTAQTPQVPNVSQQTAGQSGKPVETGSLAVAGTQSTTLSPVPPAWLDPFKTVRFLGIAFVAFIGALLMLDLFILRKRGIYRPSSHHFAHLLLLIVVGTTLAMAGVGSIL